ncbi:hypothetical protein BC937DRAFT_87868, partial [Endogone sp. FLAS-F59071]
LTLPYFHHFLFSPFLISPFLIFTISYSHHFYFRNMPRFDQASNDSTSQTPLPNRSSQDEQEEYADSSSLSGNEGASQLRPEIINAVNFANAFESALEYRMYFDQAVVLSLPEDQLEGVDESGMQEFNQELRRDRVEPLTGIQLFQMPQGLAALLLVPPRFFLIIVV